MSSAPSPHPPGQIQARHGGTAAPAEGVEVLTFNLAGETFALEAVLVREVLDRSPETHVPGAPAFVDALINFRGRVIPLADLRFAFGLEARNSSRDSRIIVIEFNLDDEPQLIGLRADKVHEVTTLAHARTEAAPRLGLRWRPDFIRGLAKSRGDIIILPDLERIFATRGQDGAVRPPAPHAAALALPAPA